MMLNVFDRSYLHIPKIEEVRNARANGTNIDESVRKVMDARCLIEWHGQTLSV